MDQSWAQAQSFVPSGHMGPIGAVVLVFGLLGAGFGATLVAAFAYWLGLRRARADEIALLESSAAALRPGPRRMVRGKVERTGAAEAPVEVDILEMVHDHTSKQAKWHTWEETHRTVRAEPFRLVGDDGTVVLVEPTQDVLVVDSLVSSYPQDRPLHRVRSAVLAHGTEVFAYGDLHRTGSAAQGPYRESGSGFVLRPPRGGTMLIATQSLRERHDGVIRWLGRWLAAGAAAFVLIHAAFSVPFLLTSIFHEDAEAQVGSTRTVTTKTKNGYAYDYQVSVRTADGFELVREPISVEAYREIVRRGGGSYTENRVVVPILRTFDSPTLSFVGSSPHLAAVPPTIALLLVVLGIVIAIVSSRSKLAWYDMKKLSEPGGDGHWEEPRPARPVLPVEAS